MKKRILLLVVIGITIFFLLIWHTRAQTCGNGVCETGETNANCEQDCCSSIYDTYESVCVLRGWEQFTVDVNGLPRVLLWKGPTRWSKGAIILLHGGSGHQSNACANVPAGQPMVDFSDLAISQGYAVFAPDSSYNLSLDYQGIPTGKRWDCMGFDRPNKDLVFLEKIIENVIPYNRPADSSTSVFMAGISNGGFMTILTATHYGDTISAFSPVAAGDPYGTITDMSIHPVGERICAPGVFYDIETGIWINSENACNSADYPNELDWSTTINKPPFKQFHHRGDGVCDFSCMEKVQEQLVAHGYNDNGPFILDDGGRSTERHFWQADYNQPMLDFFSQYSSSPDQVVITQHGGLDRKYIYHVPPNYDGSPVPLLIALHGGGGDAEDIVDYFQLNHKADHEGFIVVYPEGTGETFLGNLYGSWNAGTCCSPASENNVDDVGFIDQMLDEIEANLNIDSTRIYVTGMSNGAMMSYRLACDLSDRIAAIAPVGAPGVFEECNLARAVPTLHMHGREDQCAKYDGCNPCVSCAGRYLVALGFDIEPELHYWQGVQEFINQWKQINNCTGQSEISQKGNVTYEISRNCSDNAEVILTTIGGMGHTWPGQSTYWSNVCLTNPTGLLCIELINIMGPLSNEINANDEMWEFFKDHPLTTSVPTSCSLADTNSDNVIDIVELMSYISDWKAGSVQMTQLMTAIGEWKNGC